MRGQGGFSLIELLIVIAIILVIAAMAIPHLLGSKLAANEATAVASMRTLVTAETTYAFTYPTVGFSDSLTKLAAPTGSNPVDQNAAGLVDWILGCATQPCFKSGYNFSIGHTSGTPIDTYDITAVPAVVGQTGRRGFCTDQKGVIKYDPNGGSACTNPVQ